MLKRKVNRLIVALISLAMIMGSMSGNAIAASAPPSGPDDEISTSTQAFLNSHDSIQLDTSGGRSFRTVLENYITVDGIKLMDGANELKFASLNYPQATTDNEWEQRNAIKTILAMGGNVTRTYTIPVYNGSNASTAYVTGAEDGQLTYNEEALNKLDQLLAICNEYGIRVIIPLVDHWHWIGGMDGYCRLAGISIQTTSGLDPNAWQFYTNETCRDYFKQMISHLTERVNSISGIKYKDDPAIICWETGNELAAYDDTANPRFPQSWTTEIAAHLKSTGIRQLVLDGKMDAAQESLKDSNVDILGSHYYTGAFAEKLRKDTNLSFNTGTYPGIAQVTDHDGVPLAGKPFILGEFGTYTDYKKVETVFRAGVEEGTNGIMMWSLRAHKDGYGYYFHPEDPGNWASYHWPGFPSGDYYDETAIVRTIYAFAQIMNGVIDTADYIDLDAAVSAARNITIPAPETEEAPLLYQITTVGDIQWRGVVGGSWYEIQRADGIVAQEQADLAAWTTIADESDYIYDSGRNWEDKNEPCIAGYHDKTAVSGQAYSYRLRAVNESGTGAWSNIVSVSQAEHVILDELQMISVSSTDQNPAEIRNVYSYDHSANVTVSGGTLQNKSDKAGYISYGEGIPIEKAVINTTGVPLEGNEPEVYLSKDDITYVRADVTAESGKQYVIENVSARTPYYFARVYINGNNACVLDSVEMTYTYTGAGDENDSLIILPVNALIQDDTFGEGAEPAYAVKSDNLMVVSGAAIRGLAANDNNTAQLLYKTGDDMTAYRVNLYTRNNADVKVEISMDGVSFTEVQNSVNTGTVGNYTEYSYADVDISDAVRVLRISYPAGQEDVVVKSAEVSSGSRHLPMTDSSPVNVLEDGEYYFGNDDKLLSAYTVNINGTQGTFTKVLDHMDFSEYDALFAWVQGDGSSNQLIFRITDAGGNEWTAAHSLNGSGAQMVKLNFDEFTCDEPGAVLDLTDISAFSMGVNLDGGVMDFITLALSREYAYTGNYGIELGYTAGGSDVSKIYVDNIYVSSLTKVDDYEGYNGANTLLQGAYSRNTNGGAFDMSLDINHKSQGTYGLRIDYDYQGKGYAGATKAMDYLNLKEFDGIMVYYEPDGSGNSVTLQIEDEDGLSWESVGLMDSVGPTILYMPFDSFIPPSWDTREGSFDRTKDIKKFSIYTNQAGDIKEGTIYFDDLKGAGFVSDLEGNAQVQITSEDARTVTSFPYEITGTAGYVNYVTLQIGDKKINVPVQDGTWSYELKKEDGIYNGSGLALSAGIFYHNGDIIKQDTGKTIHIQVEGNDKPADIEYDIVWSHDFNDGMGSFGTEGFQDSAGAVYKLENGNLVTWSQEAYSGILSCTVPVENGIYTLGNSIRSKPGMINVQMALKSGDREVRSVNLDTEDVMQANVLLGDTIEVRNNQIEILYYVEAPSGGMVFSVNDIRLYKTGDINYLVNGDFGTLLPDWPNLPSGWDVSYEGGDGWSPVKGESGAFVGYADNPYTFRISQDIEALEPGLYKLSADIVLNDGTVNDVAMTALAGGDIIKSESVLDRLRGGAVQVSLDDIAVSGGAITVMLTGDIGNKGLSIDNVSLIRTGALPRFNYVNNPGFEENGQAVAGNEIIGWEASDSWGTGTLSKTEAGGCEGDYALSRWYSDPYWAKNTQTITGLPQGIYTLNAWAQSKAAEEGKPYLITKIMIRAGEEPEKEIQVEASGAWKQYTISDIEIRENDTVIISIYTNDTAGGGWSKIDMVELNRTKDLPEVPPTDEPTVPPTEEPTPPPVIIVTPEPTGVPQIPDVRKVVPQITAGVRKNAGMIQASLDEEIKRAAAMASSQNPLSLTITIPSDEAVKKITDKKLTGVRITVTLPDEVLSNNAVTVEKIMIPKEIISQAKKNGKTVYVPVEAEDGRQLYTWNFNGKKLKASKTGIKEMDLSLDICGLKENDIIWNVLSGSTGTSGGIVLTPSFTGKLPCPASLRVYAGDRFKPGQELYLYTYNQDSNKLNAMAAGSCRVNKNGIITLTLDQYHQYVLTEQLPPDNKVISLAEQVTVPKTKALAIKKSFQIDAVLPDGILKKDVKITYSSNKPEIVKVSKTGKATAVKKGTAVITAAIRIGNEIKTHKTAITVK